MDRTAFDSQFTATCGAARDMLLKQHDSHTPEFSKDAFDEGFSAGLTTSLQNLEKHAGLLDMVRRVPKAFGSALEAARKPGGTFSQVASTFKRKLIPTAKGPSTAAQLKDAVAAREQTRSTLQNVIDSERSAHAATRLEGRQALAGEQAAHSASRQAAAESIARREQHIGTQNARLQRGGQEVGKRIGALQEQVRSGEQALAHERAAHSAARKIIANEQAAHSASRLELTRNRDALNASGQALAGAQAESAAHAAAAKRNRNIAVGTGIGGLALAGGAYAAGNSRN